MPAVAITDHGNHVRRDRVLPGGGRRRGDQADHRLRGVHGAGFAPGRRSGESQRDTAFHFTLLAKDDDGLRNLVKLVSIAHLDGMYYKPRIDKELLAQHSAGLIGLSGCLKGEVQLWRSSDGRLREGARARGGSIATSSGRRISSSKCTITASRRSSSATRCCRGSAKELGLGLVAANDVHFLERDAPRGARRADLHRHRLERHRRAPDALRAGALFQVAGGDGGAFRRASRRRCDNTLAIAERCDAEDRIRHAEVSELHAAGRA